MRTHPSYLEEHSSDCRPVISFLLHYLISRFGSTGCRSSLTVAFLCLSLETLSPSVQQFPFHSASSLASWFSSPTLLRCDLSVSLPLSLYYTTGGALVYSMPLPVNPPPANQPDQVSPLSSVVPPLAPLLFQASTRYSARHVEWLAGVSTATNRVLSVCPSDYSISDTYLPRSLQQRVIYTDTHSLTHLLTRYSSGRSHAWLGSLSYGASSIFLNFLLVVALYRVHWRSWVPKGGLIHIPNRIRTRFKVACYKLNPHGLPLPTPLIQPFAF